LGIRKVAIRVAATAAAGSHSVCWKAGLSVAGLGAAPPVWARKRAPREMVMLRKVVQVGGGDIGPGWEFVVLHHTDCGITRLEGQSKMLSEFFEVGQGQLAEQAVSDPVAVVAVDVATLRADTRLPGVRISGLVYDVNTGLVDTVVKP
jgi:carbonic anhydrase